MSECVRLFLLRRSTPSSTDAETFSPIRIPVRTPPQTRERVQVQASLHRRIAQGEGIQVSSETSRSDPTRTEHRGRAAGRRGGVINMSHGDSQLEMGLTRIGLIAAFGKFLPDADLTGAAGWTRTSDLRIRSPLLYPPELQPRLRTGGYGCGDYRRIDVTSTVGLLARKTVPWPVRLARRPFIPCLLLSRPARTARFANTGSSLDLHLIRVDCVISPATGSSCVPRSTIRPCSRARI